MLWKRFCLLRTQMSVKLNFLRSCMDYFPKNCEDLCEELSAHFHQDIRIIEERYHGHLDVNLLADNSWCLKRDVVAAKPRGKRRKDFSSRNTEWNDTIVVLKKTALQLYFKTFIEKINSGNLIM